MTEKSFLMKIRENVRKVKWKKSRLEMSVHMRGCSAKEGLQARTI